MQGSQQGSSQNKVWQSAVIISILAAIIINALSNFFPISGQNIGEISNTIFAPVLITPANYAFAIWGLIYIGLIAFGIYQASPAQRDNARLEKVRAPIVAACVFQMVWVFLFTAQQFWLSVVLMFGILLSLIAAYGWSRMESSELRGANRVAQDEKIFSQIPISLYLGWISVASIVNVASALYISGWDGWGIAPVVWTGVMLAIAAAMTTIITIQFQDAAFGFVIVWALIAIAVRQSGQLALSATAFGLAIALLLLIGFTQYKSKQYKSGDL
ncbi:tryptophan-rich sensory protein [Myxacorys almedinensis]|uniref:Tryptophan-rich sensory protein n=1 Tax=Myxacorys almedinensis A TaxID=2690445 RepID=A0A8J8CHH1_9CYAN|nr:tryptophan-rich sensory protein [Myxacorys almedinensis]NDJ16713.1 tryptophan-rich sensory protein [Myxacorys almedinensis A]